MRPAPIPPTPSGTNLTGKTVIVTGGNAGLGLEAARQFLVLGASRLILACRSIPRGEEAASALRRNSEVAKINPDAIIQVFELDLDDYDSGLQFAARVKREVKELDILLNNGGIALMSYEKSKNGHERTMQVNCYTYALICLELLPLLRSTAAIRGSSTRITFVGSATQTTQSTVAKHPVASGRNILEHFDDLAVYNRFARYADSKLVVNALTRSLAKLAPSEVVVNNLCPGLVQTGLDKNLPFVLRGFMGLVRKARARTVEEGARTLIYAAVVAGKETNGKFLANNEINPGAAFLNKLEGDDFVERLWRDLVDKLATVDPSLKDY